MKKPPTASNDTTACPSGVAEDNPLAGRPAEPQGLSATRSKEIPSVETAEVAAQRDL